MTVELFFLNRWLNRGAYDNFCEIFPDVDDVDIEQVINAVDSINLEKFRYRTLQEYGYEMLLSPPLSYLSSFTGLGGVIPRNYTGA